MLQIEEVTFYWALFHTSFFAIAEYLSLARIITQALL